MLNWTKYQISLTTQQPFRVGGPDDPLSGEHHAIARVGSVIVIPGSTLKGALRQSMENFLIDKYYENGAWQHGKEFMMPCIPGAKNTLSKEEDELIKTKKYREGGNCSFKTGKSFPICPVCYFLGAMGLEGFVRVPFLTAEVIADKLYSSRMDRAVKTVAGKTNRPYELVPNPTQFTGELEVLIEDSIIGWRCGSPRLVGERKLGDQWLEWTKYTDVNAFIQEYVLDRMTDIDRLSGYKSKGFGKVKIQVGKIEAAQ